MESKQNKNQQPNSSYRVVSSLTLEPLSAGWALDNFLRSWTQEDIEIAIQKNFEWNLKGFKITIVNYVKDEILKWFRTYRPDLYTPLSTLEGTKWLKANIEKALTQT